jgi:hypothetical protein
MRRLTIKQAGGTKLAFSPIKQRMVVYSKCQALATAEHFEYDLTTLKNDYNSELTNQSIDAFVEDCKKIRTTFQDNLSIDLWVAGESPLDPLLVAVIIGILILSATLAYIVILSSTATFIERVFPKMKFYTPDGKVFDTLAEYITYMQNVYNPSVAKPYTCMYCGQGFATEAERDAHQANCPWKAGPPSPETDWVSSVIALLVVGGIVVGAVVILPKVLDLVRGK